MEILDYIKNSGSIISPEILYKLNNLNTLYQTANYSMIDQHCVQDLLKKYDKNSPQRKELENIVKKYYPEYSEKNIQQLLKLIDTEGVCDYATAVNQIVDFYRDNPEGFRNDFGFDLYVKEFT